MIFFVLGAIDALGGAILFFGNTNQLFTYVGMAMMVKGTFSIAGDLVYILSGK